MSTLRISECLEKVEERERALPIAEEKRVFREEGALEHEVREEFCVLYPEEVPPCPGSTSTSASLQFGRMGEGC